MKVISEQELSSVCRQCECSQVHNEIMTLTNYFKNIVLIIGLLGTRVVFRFKSVQ